MLEVVKGLMAVFLSHAYIKACDLSIMHALTKVILYLGGGGVVKLHFTRKRLLKLSVDWLKTQ